MAIPEQILPSIQLHTWQSAAVTVLTEIRLLAAVVDQVAVVLHQQLQALILLAALVLAVKEIMVELDLVILLTVIVLVVAAVEQGRLVVRVHLLKAVMVELGHHPIHLGEVLHQRVKTLAVHTSMQEAVVETQAQHKERAALAEEPLVLVLEVRQVHLPIQEVDQVR
jgi:hypothetical protein